ncbi:phage tail family protein [Streptomyces sp. ADMS]|uniref:phage distal tail protein n=1 Tax=Streptomyces sp. ADMS TaxID=3071415 RepID=UPI00296F91E5|nr:phage tail domain-containing protein [Streptomyces sp. ADMS]MDW4905099.1 phage tail family protein [Streptomyces sp. ADMS]
MVDLATFSAAGALVTRPGHVQYGDLLLGPGTPYRWKTLTGWEDLPPLDSGTVERADAHGAFPGQLLAQSRTVGVDGLVVRAPRAQIGEVVGRLSAATSPRVDEIPLVAWLDERGPLLAYARATRRAIPTTLGYRVGTITDAAIEWVATDPRRYALAEQSVRAMLPVSEDGLKWEAAAVEVLPADQAAGVGEVWRWWTDGDPVITGDDTGPVSVQPLTAFGELVWAAESSDHGWTATAGQEVTFGADLAARTAALVTLRWWDAAGQHVADSTSETGAASFTATAPAGAAFVQPVVTFPAALAAPVTVGTSSLRISTTAGVLAWPLDFGTPGSTGRLSVVNTGSADTHPVIEFRGPVTAPSLTNITTGDVLEYDLPLAAGDVLVVDTLAGTVVLNSTASRLYTATTRSVPEQTFTFGPGTTPLMFRAAPGSTDPAASAVVRYRAAYW